MIGQTYHRELLSGRPPSPITIATANISYDPEEHVTVCWHLIYIPAPTEFVGFHMAAAYGEGIVEDQLPYFEAKGRFWVQTANTDNFLPFKVIPGSDTAFIDGTGTYEVDIGWYSPYIFTPDIPETDFTLDIMLPNPVRVDVAGMYWIGWAHTSYGNLITAKMRASTVVGHQRGLMDLHYVGTTPENTGVGEGVSALVLPEGIEAAGVDIVPHPYYYPNIDIWLICQHLTDGVPYGPS